MNLKRLAAIAFRDRCMAMRGKTVSNRYIEKKRYREEGIERGRGRRTR